MHAREGLYKAMKQTSPGEAMIHLERAKLLQDSIYQQETGEALSKYNAIYYNDILQKEKERTEQRNHTFLAVTAVSFAGLLFTIVLAILYTYRRHKRKIRDYEHDINSLEDKSAKLYQQYHNVVAESMQIPEGLTDDDKAFLERLTNVINSTTEKGISDIASIATQMHISTLALRRRLSQTLSVTTKAYIMQVRMQKAKDLLQNYRDLTVAEVATKCGYTQVPNFTRAFKNFYGIMPTEMKNERMKK